MANELKALMARRAELLQEVRTLDLDYEEKSASIRSRMDSVLESIAERIEADGDKKPAPKKRTAPKKPKQPDHDKVATQYTGFEPCPTGCLCGCGEDVAEGASFVRGHQHKLRSIAMAVHACKLDSDKLSSAGMAYAVAQNWMGSGAE